MVEASEFVADEPLLAFVQHAGVHTASVSAVQDGTDAFADLRHSDRRCPFFSPAVLLSPRTKWQSVKVFDGGASPSSCEPRSRQGPLRS